MLDCIQSVEQWMASNRLRLNQVKSVFMWFCTTRRFHLADISRFNLADGDAEASDTVCDLGAFFDHAMTMTERVNRLPKHATINYKVSDQFDAHCL